MLQQQFLNVANENVLVQMWKDLLSYKGTMWKKNFLFTVGYKFNWIENCFVIFVNLNKLLKTFVILFF